MKNNLKELRKKAGLSLEALGVMTGMSKGHIWELESQRSVPTLLRAYRIATVLGVDVTDVWPNEVEVVTETITVRRVRTE